MSFIPLLSPVPVIVMKRAEQWVMAGFPFHLYEISCDGGMEHEEGRALPNAR